jgi:hypothetical protein
MTQRLGALRRYVNGWAMLFCVGDAEATVRIVRHVDSTSSADVPLEKLAVRPHAVPESGGTWRFTPSCLPSREESERPLANVEDTRQQCWTDE